MNAPTQFTRPLRATGHCRHYSYETGNDASNDKRGPTCALGLDLSQPRASNTCMPDPDQQMCSSREDYTTDEHTAWDEYSRNSMSRLSAAIKALPSPIPVDSSCSIPCPNCGGRLHYARWERGAQIACTTSNCCAARFNLAAGIDWPAGGARG